MRILLDTNIIIHREASQVHINEIGVLFRWIDILGYEKWVHHLSIKEIETHKDEEVVRTMKTKIQNYKIHNFDSEDDSRIKELRKGDKSLNDNIDTSILKEVYEDRFDLLVTQDKNLFKKSIKLGIDSKVYSIESFLGMVNKEYPQFKDYKVLAARKEFFGKINLKDPFFDSFKMDYSEFEHWFRRKSEDEVYVCETDGNVRAFLFLKLENYTENYTNITPPFPRKKRLKIGTFKVESTGFKLGERFLKIIFDNAILFQVDEIYVTIFDKRDEQKLLIELLTDWGFEKWGTKETPNGIEQVFTRKIFQPINKSNPKLSYPIISRSSKKFLVPIYPEYHTNLLPDSILNNESPKDFIENEPYRNAIKKAYISGSFNRNINKGDLIIFYRTGGRYKSVITTIGIVENVFQRFENEVDFLNKCRKRTVLNNQELKEFWNYNPKLKPFVVTFLQVYSFPIRINLDQLVQLGVIPNFESAPRGFEEISGENFNKILKATKSDENFIID
ncbi:hypothetical protein [Fluviicola sp.]|uniref:hypothetical protein n=1 Tax=Fluviicola sp. TaxID=1917219 RepID=UPI003D2CFAD2